MTNLLPVFANPRERDLEACPLLRNALVAAAASLCAAWIAPAAAGPREPALRVVVDQARIVPLPPGVATVIVGNPAIADVTLLKAEGGLLLTGKGYGSTNMLALDANGELLADKRIVVDPPSHVLVLQNGDARRSFACDPVCMPAAVLGDSSSAFGDVAGEITAHDALAGHGGAAGGATAAAAPSGGMGHAAAARTGQ